MGSTSIETTDNVGAIHDPDSALVMLGEIRSFGSSRCTQGLSDTVVTKFLQRDPNLILAIAEAYDTHKSLRKEWKDALSGDEAVLLDALQEDYVNFYGRDAINPYVPLAGRGPWVVTSHGGVLHDSGGYGMLGFGHAPQGVIHAMSAPWVMANVMTPSFSHKRLSDRLKTEIGHTRGACPFEKFLCMNSGSESVTVASRISDVHVIAATAPGARHHNKTVKFLSLKGSFHGRTDRPAQISDSTLPKYRANLASYVNRKNLITVAANDVDGLRRAFAKADEEGVYIEAMFMEPVMGEGNPGQGISREFYDAARELTKEHDSLFVVDSIQAGIRGHGCLSIVDYPGFEDAEAPDMETYSKALNAGQYPLSVLAMTRETADLYVRGVYGNTMTTNPRAVEVACEVLDQITDDFRQNIRDRGKEFLEKLSGLGAEFPHAVRLSRGTGLLLALELEPEKYPVVGIGGVEEYCRKKGLGVIHGGENALRFTPHFGITSAEIDLIIDVVRDALRHFGS